MTLEAGPGWEKKIQSYTAERESSLRSTSEKVLCVSAVFPRLEASEKCVLFSMALCECLLPGHEEVHSMAVRWGKHSWWATQSF